MKLPRLSRLAVLVLATCSTPPPAAAPSQPAPSGPPAASAPSALASEQDKALYALGFNLATSVQPLELSPDELDAVVRGLRDGAARKTPAVDLARYSTEAAQLGQRRLEARASQERSRGEELIARAAAQPGARRLDSGVVLAELAPGSGASPTAHDRVRVHYRGTLADGREFDSSLARGQPAEFELANVIPCWSQGLQRLKAGAKARLACPASTAYGDRGAPPMVPPGAALEFEVELLAVLPH